jgi:thioredoxin 1
VKYSISLEVKIRRKKMKNLVLVFVVTFAFCTTAMASDIAFYVGQWNTDGWYDASQFDHVETIIAETGYLFKDIQQFDDNQFDEFGVWVDENTNDGEMDIIWLNGCMPSVLYPFPNLQPDGSRAEEWLDGGNMFINVGGWFGYTSFEGGSRQDDNRDSGAANILDLSDWIILFFGDNTQMKVTPTGKEYLPSLNDCVTTDRPVVLIAVDPPWEVAAIFASLGGTDDPNTEAQADPVVLHNTETDGYIAFINQVIDGPDSWIEDRGLTCAEFIGNWVRNVIGLSKELFATAPIPKDGAHDTDTSVTLSWRPGIFAVSHDIYFGDNFNDVNDGAAGTFQCNQTATSFNVGLPGSPYPNSLVPGTTYYWRVDEVNDTDPNSPWKGNVWCFATRPPEGVIRLTDASFDDIVLGSDVPVLVDFWATWCGPCWVMAPVIEQIADQYAGKIKVGKLDVDNEPWTTSNYGIRYIPTFILFKDGQEIRRWVGVTDKDKITAAIDKLL